MMTGGANAMLVALSKGYVVAAPGARGRTTQAADGTYTGKAPALIVDMKAAVRYLRHNAGKLPGDTEKIISNGTSAGGALSTLIGATGDSKDYEPYLKAMYPSYINSLPLVDKNGKALTLDENGRGSFADYIKSIYMASAQKALDNGTDLSSKTWPTINDGKVTDIDLAGYAVDVTRLKSAPAFDALDMSSAETEEFGTATVDKQHFTVYGKDHSTVAGSALADKDIVKTMSLSANPASRRRITGVSATAKPTAIRPLPYRQSSPCACSRPVMMSILPLPGPAAMPAITI